MPGKGKLCMWQAPFEPNERCPAAAVNRVSYRDESKSARHPLVIPAQALCTKHERQLRRGVERNYGSGGTWTAEPVSKPKPKKKKAAAAVTE